MNKEIKEQWNKFVKWYKETPEEKEERKEEEEFKELLKRYDKRKDILFLHYSPLPIENTSQIALTIENLHTQKKIVESNKTMGRATIVLAMATIALVITSAYGVEGLENAFNEIVGGVFAFIFIVAILWGVGIFGWIIKLFWRIWRKK